MNQPTNQPTRPLSRIRSDWEPFEHSDIIGVPCVWYRRRVSDGVLVACVADEPHGWHMSISFRDHKGRLSRYPRWDEISHARYELLAGDLDFAMHLPAANEYVALHDTTFHLHEHPERSAPG